MTDQTFGNYPTAPHEAPQAAATPSHVGPTAVAAYNSGASLMEALAAEAKKEIGRKVRFDLVNRPGWSAEFETNIDGDDFNRYRRTAQGKKKRAEDMDPAIFGGMVLVEYNTAVFYKGEQVVTAEGEPVTFRDKQFLNMFPGAFTQVDALVKFVGAGHLISMGNALYAEGGYGDEVVAVDPTDG